MKSLQYFVNYRHLDFIVTILEAPFFQKVQKQIQISLYPKKKEQN